MVCMAATKSSSSTSDRATLFLKKNLVMCSMQTWACMHRRVGWSQVCACASWTCTRSHAQLACCMHGLSSNMSCTQQLPGSRHSHLTWSAVGMNFSMVPESPVLGRLVAAGWRAVQTLQFGWLAPVCDELLAVSSTRHLRHCNLHCCTPLTVTNTAGSLARSCQGPSASCCAPQAGECSLLRPASRVTGCAAIRGRRQLWVCGRRICRWFSHSMAPVCCLLRVRPSTPKYGSLSANTHF